MGIPFFAGGEYHLISHRYEFTQGFSIFCRYPYLRSLCVRCCGGRLFTRHLLLYFLNPDLFDPGLCPFFCHKSCLSPNTEVVIWATKDLFCRKLVGNLVGIDDQHVLSKIKFFFDRPSTTVEFDVCFSRLFGRDF